MTSAGLKESGSPNVWPFALLSFGLAGVGGLVMAIQQFVAKFLYDQSAHVRTVWGVLFLAIGFIGPVLPLILIFKRQALLRMTNAKRWALVVGVPLAYMSVLAVCMVASTWTKVLVMNRPGLSLVIRHEGSATEWPTSLELRGLKRELPSSFGHRGVDGDVQRFRFEGYQTYLRFPREVVISAEGSSRTAADGSAEISLDLKSRERFRLQVLGFAGNQITSNGLPVVDGARFEPGSYRVAIRGRGK
jgi:hypothetical protein